MTEPVVSERRPSAPPHLPRYVLRRLERGGIALAILGGLVCLVGVLVSPGQFLRSYLIAYVFWLSIALGCLGIEMLQHVVPGAWGLIIRRPLEAASRTIAPMGVLFVPILLGLPRLYLWAQPGAAAADPLIAHKAPYLNVPFFIVRTVIYFAAWSGLALWLSRASLRQDHLADPEAARRIRKVSAGGLVVYCLTMTLASFDWLMSLNVHWYSTIYGVYLIGGQGVAAMSFAVLATLFVSRFPPMSWAVQARHFHDLGKMMLAFVMLWAYFALSQFLVIWAGNLPEEVPYYLSRTRGGFRVVSLLLVLFHFVLPFLLLLSRERKRDARRLAVVAVLLLVMRWVDVYWLVTPSLSPERLVFHWLDPAAMVAVGGVWLVLFARGLGQRPILPLRDPLLPEALDHG